MATIVDSFAAVPEPIVFRLWNGSTIMAGPTGAPACTVVVRSPRVLGRLRESPSILTLGECFLSGEIEVEGDLRAAAAAAYAVEAAPRAPDGLSRGERRREDDQAAIAFHYDRPGEFYAPALITGGFEVLHVEAFAPHYARTTAARRGRRVSRLPPRRPRARRAPPTGRAGAACPGRRSAVLRDGQS